MDAKKKKKIVSLRMMRKEKLKLKALEYFV